MKFFQVFARRNAEWMFWSIALFILFFMDEMSGSSLCFFHWLGLEQCPGCGIGHSIQAALHLRFAQSIQFHPFGILAVFIILNRIRHLILKSKQTESWPKA